MTYLETVLLLSTVLQDPKNQITVDWTTKLRSFLKSLEKFDIENEFLLVLGHGARRAIFSVLRPILTFWKIQF